MNLSCSIIDLYALQDVVDSWAIIKRHSGFGSSCFTNFSAKTAAIIEG
jgi:hypothetical protein